jgi:hypothetical protein
MSSWNARRTETLFDAQIEIRAINANKALRVICPLLGH